MATNLFANNQLEPIKSLEPKRTTENKETTPTAKTEKIEKTNEDEALTQTSTTAEEKTVKTTKKTTKAAKPRKKYYENTYNLQLNLPKEIEPLLETCGNVYGTKKDYIMHLMMEDMQKNMEEYRKKEKEIKSGKTNWYENL